MAEEAKIFLLGLGAQKTGTTWMHRYLQDHPSVSFGLMKEYHVLDALFVPECAEYRVDTLPLSEHFRHWLSRGSRPLVRHKMQQDLDWYASYFRKQVSSRGKTLTGDITPSYAGLPADALIETRQRLESAGFHPKAVFIMRDPFERCWSALRMANRKKRKAGKEITFEAELKELREKYSQPAYRLRTSYDVTIGNLKKSFLEENTLYCQFESFFTEESVRRLTEFLEIDYRPADFQRKVNTTKKPATPVPDEMIAEVVAYYRPAYEAAMQVLGEESVRKHWKNSRFL